MVPPKSAARGASGALRGAGWVEEWSLFGYGSVWSKLMGSSPAGPNLGFFVAASFFGGGLYICRVGDRPCLGGEETAKPVLLEGDGGAGARRVEVLFLDANLRESG